MAKRNRQSVVDRRWEEKEIRGRQVKDIQKSELKPPVQAKNNMQKEFLKALNTHQVTVFSAPAGCGKSLLTMSTVCDWLKKGEYNKILLSRPSVGMGKTLGLIPGDLRLKYELYLAPLLQVIYERYGRAFYETGIKNGTIELAPLEYIRGRSISDVLIVEEAQNTTADEMYTLLTRMEEGSKMIVIGDPFQLDLKGENGIDWLVKFSEKHNLSDYVKVVKATSDDVVRGGLCRAAVKCKEYDTNNGVRY